MFKLVGLRVQMYILWDNLTNKSFACIYKAFSHIKLVTKELPRDKNIPWTSVIQTVQISSDTVLFRLATDTLVSTNSGNNVWPGPGNGHLSGTLETLTHRTTVGNLNWIITIFAKTTYSKRYVCLNQTEWNVPPAEWLAGRLKSSPIRISAPLHLKT